MSYEIQVGFDVYRELMLRRRQESPTFDEIIADALGLNRKPATPRQNGQMGYRLRGAWTSARSANEVLVSVLQQLAKEDPAFLPALAHRANARARNRSYLAQDPAKLYPGRPDLVQHHSRIAPDWFLGTNISNRQKVQLLKEACETAGLIYGVDLVTRIDTSSTGTHWDGGG